MQKSEIYDLGCACANIRRASRLITNLYNNELAETGIESTQYGLLMTIFKAGEIKQGLLAEKLGMDSTSLTRSLKPLVAQQLIEERVGTDRRQKFLSLTAAGKKKHQQILPKWQRAQDKLKKAMTQEGWKKMFDSIQEATAAALQA